MTDFPFPMTEIRYRIALNTRIRRVVVPKRARIGQLLIIPWMLKKKPIDVFHVKIKRMYFARSRLHSESRLRGFRGSRLGRGR